MFRPVIILATATALTLAAASVASAKAVFVSKRVVSNGFTTCVFVRKTVISDFGDRFTKSVRVCRSIF